jgi:hypothetical protein
MITDNNGNCRASLAELEQDRELGVNPTTEEIVQERVDELMDADSTDEDSIVVLMESERFKKALRIVLGAPDGYYLQHTASCLKGTAVDVLSEYVELQL